MQQIQARSKRRSSWQIRTGSTGWRPERGRSSCGRERDLQACRRSSSIASALKVRCNVLSHASVHTGQKPPSAPIQMPPWQLRRPPGPHSYRQETSVVHVVPRTGRTAGQRGSRKLRGAAHCQRGVPVGHGSNRAPPFQVQVVHTHADPSDGSEHHERSAPQAWPVAAADDEGQLAAGVSAGQTGALGPIVDQTPLLQIAVALHVGPRGSSPYSQRAPLVVQALEAAGQVDGQGAAWRVPGVSDGQASAEPSAPGSGLDTSIVTPSACPSGASDVETRHVARHVRAPSRATARVRGASFVEGHFIIARSNRNRTPSRKAVPCPKML